MPPPPPLAELPLIVLSVTVRLPHATVNAAAAAAGRVAADRAVGDGQVFATANRSAVAVHVAAGERQAADRNVEQVGAVAVVDVEHPAAVAVVHVRRRVVAAGVDREQVRARAVDRERVGDRQLALRERDRGRAAAGERRRQTRSCPRPPTRFVAKIASRSDVTPSLKSTVSPSVLTVTTASSRRSSSGSIRSRRRNGCRFVGRCCDARREKARRNENHSCCVLRAMR